MQLRSYCAKNKSLTLDEVPRLSNYSRSENLSAAYFETKLPDRRLWVEILSGFRWGFVKQVVLISIVSFTQFVGAMLFSFFLTSSLLLLENTFNKIETITDDAIDSATCHVQPA
jgi:hypothetical protein